MLHTASDSGRWAMLLADKVRGRTSVLMASLAGVTLAVYANYAGILSALLPSQVEEIDPENKITNLAVIVSVSAAFTIIAQPLIGALSDRTRSRLGRRAPWMLAGSLAAAAFLFAWAD
ncbi:MFS transporter [Glaciibacter superstes]|uniref:MFS transporter n=1 Tax=Glaciibacter superstes TaxID=501023 RepID=UPI0012F78BE6|nr:MFS transporter [Glaciibacter superstes]